ncbi:hypothetical protein GYA37_03935 [candidate division WWE3 bacterium]|uniref:Uncharacterized protein n=1 Tax=candidate division WWE3 bacterium TaxID=2053526 RepID=A0A7X9E7X1_UNCKA|nr:hypothetical protein [candidate division WWE3 bacterium]
MENEALELKPLISESFELIPPTNKDKAEKYEELKSVLEKYDIEEAVSNILNLKWKQKVFVNDTDSKFGADYKLPNIASVNYSRGALGAMGVAHEMVHLLMGQNSWTDIPEINEYIQKHEDLKDFSRMRTVGYPIEQMVAYLLMRDVALDISESDESVDKERINSQYNDAWFARILDSEYPTEHLKTLGKKIIDDWEARPKDVPVTDWIKKLITTE